MSETVKACEVERLTTWQQLKQLRETNAGLVNELEGLLRRIDEYKQGTASLAEFSLKPYRAALDAAKGGEGE